MKGSTPLHQRLLLFSCAMIALPIAVAAVDTKRLELRTGESNDGVVYLTRDGDGNLVLADAHTTATLTLLRHEAQSHSLLDDLDADDHPQYLSESRHLAVHDAAFNDTLPITADIAGNESIGAHAQDDSIHLHRDMDEDLEGAWRFLNGASFLGGAIRIEHMTGAVPVLRFDDIGTPRRFYFDLGDSQFVLEGALAASSLRGGTVRAPQVFVSDAMDGRVDGTPTATIEGFAEIEGIAAGQLLGASSDASISGEWNFARSVGVGAAHSGLSAEVAGVAVTLEADVTGGDGDGRERAAVRGTLDGAATGIGARPDTRLVGVWGEAILGGIVAPNAEGIVAGVVGIGSATDGDFITVGVAAVAPEGDGTGPRVALVALLDPAQLTNTALFPQDRALAGLFAGDTVTLGEAESAAVVLRGSGDGAPGVRLMAENTGVSAISVGDLLVWGDADGGTIAVEKAGAAPSPGAIAGIAESAGIPEALVSMTVLGSARVVVSAAVSPGDLLAWDGTEFSPAGTGDLCVGVALEGGRRRNPAPGPAVVVAGKTGALRHSGVRNTERAKA